MIVRARPPPSHLAEALEIAEPLVTDLRLREEEKEAIAWLIRELKRGKPTRHWIDPTSDDQT